MQCPSAGMGNIVVSLSSLCLLKYPLQRRRIYLQNEASFCFSGRAAFLHPSTNTNYFWCCAQKCALSNIVGTHGKGRIGKGGIRLPWSKNPTPSPYPFSRSQLSMKKQEQTKFDDLRRGITEDWQSLAKF